MFLESYKCNQKLFFWLFIITTPSVWFSPDLNAAAFLMTAQPLPLSLEKTMIYFNLNKNHINIYLLAWARTPGGWRVRWIWWRVRRWWWRVWWHCCWSTCCGRRWCTWHGRHIGWWRETWLWTLKLQSVYNIKYNKRILAEYYYKIIIKPIQRNNV